MIINVIKPILTAFTERMNVCIQGILFLNNKLIVLLETRVETHNMSLNPLVFFLYVCCVKLQNTCYELLMLHS